MIRAVLDADVLYPMPLRDTLLSAMVEGCFQAFWSRDILDEVLRNLTLNGLMHQAQAARLRQILEIQFDDSMVSGYHSLIAAMPNHPKDRHVAACAVKAGADLIVRRTYAILRPFPPG